MERRSKTARLRASPFSLTALGIFLVGTSFLDAQKLALFGTPSRLAWLHEWLKFRTLAGAALLLLAVLTIYSSRHLHRAWARRNMRGSALASCAVIITLAAWGATGPFLRPDLGKHYFAETMIAGIWTALIACGLWRSAARDGGNGGDTTPNAAQQAAAPGG